MFRGIARAIIIAIIIVAAALVVAAVTEAPRDRSGIGSEGVRPVKGLIRSAALDQPEYSINGLNQSIGGAVVWAVAVDRAERARIAAETQHRATQGPIRAADPGPPGHTGVDWDSIARCETAHDPRNPNPGSAWWGMQGSTYSGGVGFYNGTWDSFGGRQFAVNAGLATREQQIIVAERVYARYGLSGWGCREYG